MRSRWGTPVPVCLSLSRQAATVSSYQFSLFSRNFPRIFKPIQTRVSFCTFLQLVACCAHVHLAFSRSPSVLELVLRPCAQTSSFLFACWTLSPCDGSFLFRLY